MRFIYAILLLIGCSTSKTTLRAPDTAIITIRLDGSKSRIINGNGKGYIKTWKWRQIQGPYYPIDNSNSIVTKTSIGHGNYAWEAYGEDNLGNADKDTFNFKW